MKYIIIFIALFMTGSLGFAQISFGPEFGHYNHVTVGVHDIDGVIAEGNRNNPDEFFGGEGFGGLFLEIPVFKSIEMLTKLTVRPIYPTFKVFDLREPRLFGHHVTKVGTIGVTNLSVSLLPQISLPSLKGFTVKVYGGGNINFNFVTGGYEYSFAKGYHARVARVMNSMDRAVKPITFAWVYGISLNYWRIVLSYYNQRQSSYSDKIYVNGSKYKFQNTWSFSHISIAYKFYGFKRRKKEGTEN